MAFPVDADLGTKVMLSVGGTWTDITPYTYLQNPITVTRGRADEGARVDYGRATVVLNNQDGRFSPRNPLSPYYGMIGRNTPIRVSVQAGSSYLIGPGGTGFGTGAQVADTSAIDVTGDLDVRVDATLDNWNASGTVELAGKFTSATNQRSWMLTARNGGLHFEWSANGTTATQTDSTAKLPGRRRLAVRVTLDVDNGAGGSTVTFWTAPSLAGTWTQLGAPIVTAGVTSIFNSTAPLLVGRATDIAFTNPSGQIWGAEIRNGIGGTVVAAPDFTIQTPGARSFTDSAGRAWTVNGNTAISNERIRFQGEVSNWPVTWGNGSGMDVRTSVTAAGILRRLGQGSSPLQSTLRRRIPSFAPLAYWPMEEAAGSTQAYSPISGVRPMRVSGDLTFAADDTLAGSSALPTVGSASGIRGTVNPPAGSPTSWHVEWVYKLPAAPTSQSTIMQFAGTGTVALWTLQLAAGTFWVLGQDGDGNTVVDSPWAIGSDLYDGRWNRVQFYASVSGGTVTWTSQFINVGGGGGAPNGTYTGTLGRITTVMSPPQFPSTLSGMALGHVAVFSPTQLSAYNSADTGFNGETAGTRMLRVAGEEGIPLTIFGDPGGQAKMGPQKPAAILDLLGDAGDADGGILYERRGSVALAYRDLNGLYNQPVTMALDYTAKGHVAPPLQPTDDDQGIKNDITVTRVNGSSARVALDVGPLSVLAPPNGVGPYAGSAVTLNLYDDDQPEQQAGWRLHLGTWDEARYPSVKVNLAKASGLIDAATALDSGDLVSVTNLPSWLPPDDLLLMVQGYTETIGVRTWDITYNCTPGGPWSTIAVVDDPGSRADTDGSQLAWAVSSTDTGVGVATTSGPVWTTDPADVPFDIKVGGEVMTVAAVGQPLAGAPATTAIADTFVRTVSSGWGTATSGDAWTTSGGAAGDYAVNGTAGTHSVPAVASSRRTLVGPTSGNADVTVTFATSAIAAGAAQHAAIVMRHTDVDNMLMLQARLSPSQTVEARIVTRIAATETDLAAAAMTSLTHQPGGWLRMRAQAFGTLFRIKIWDSTVGEPPIWNNTAIASTMTGAGLAGLRSFLFTGNTNVLPVTFSWDDLTAKIPSDVSDPRIAPMTLPIWRQAADTAATTPVTVAVIGSSTAAGSMGTLASATLRRSTTMWGAVLRARHNASAVPGGFGVPAANIGLTNEWTRSGGANVLNRGLGFTAWQLAAGNYAERPWYGTAVTILFEQGAAAGAFDVSIDGGAATRVTPDPAAARNTGTWTSPTLALGSHTVRITGATGNTVIEAVYGHDRDTTSGVRVWNGGLPGATTAELANTPGLATRLGQLKPSLVVLMLTANDLGANVDPAVTKARIQAWLTDLFAAVSPTPDVLLVHQHQRFDGTHAYPWSAYLQVAQEIADADSRVHLVDVSGLFPTSQAADVWDLIDADNTHLTERGHQILTDALASVTALPAGVSQIVTLSARSVNGIAKSHPSGEDVSLAYPAYTAL